MKNGVLCFLREKGHSLKKSCELLRASTSGFYDRLKRKSAHRKDKDKRLKKKIKKIFDNSDGNYGSPRIHKSLQNDGETIGENKVAKLMKEDNLNAKKKKAFRPKTTINNPSDKKSPRVFKGNVASVTAPNQVWVSDLTCLPTESGFSYLVTVMDLYNREIKGWDVSDSMEALNTKNALLQALRSTEGQLNGLTFHSDQGVQYCSSDVRDKLKLLDIVVFAAENSPA